MRVTGRGARAWLCGAGALLLAACYEDAVSPLEYARPAEVWWLEWPAQVAGAAGESLRVVVSAPCGPVNIAVTADSARLTVVAEALGDPALRCAVIPYDTMLPLPALAPSVAPTATQPAAFAVQARVRNYVTAAFELATLGELQLTAQPPAAAVRRAAGRAALGIDSGCAWVRPATGRDETYYLLNPPLGLGEGEQPRPALVGGDYVPVEPPQCGHATGLQLSYAQIDVLP